MMSKLNSVRGGAHRFKITYFRQRAKKKMIASPLDQIPGIGLVRRKKLLQHFSNINALKAATAEDLVAVPGFTRQVAEKLKKGLPGEDAEKMEQTETPAP